MGVLHRYTIKPHLFKVFFFKYAQLKTSVYLLNKIMSLYIVFQILIQPPLKTDNTYYWTPIGIYYILTYMK